MFGDIEITTRKFQEFLKIEQERQLAMQELSQILGYDVTFSKEEMIRNAKNHLQNMYQRRYRY